MVMMTNPFAKFPNQPTDHFFERLGGSTLRKDNSITFQSDLSSSTGWTTTGSKVSIDTTNEEIDFSFNTDNGDLSHTYYDLTSVSDTKWVLRSQIDIDTVTQGSDVNDVFIFHGIGSTNQNGNETQDFLGLMFRVDNTKTDIFAIETDGSHPNNETTTLFTRQLQAETLYVEMIRESATSFTVNLYSDSGYSTLLESKTITVPSSVQTLRYLKVAGIQGFSDSQVVGSVPNITLYNDVTSATIPATWTMQPTWRDDFSSSTGWTTANTGISINTSTEEIDWNANSAVSGVTYYDLGVGIPANKWVLQAEVTVDNFSHNSDGTQQNLFLGLSDSNSNMYTNQEYLGVRIETSSFGDLITTKFVNGTTLFVDQQAFAESLTTTTYYVEIKRTSSTGATMSLYTDNTYTTLIEAENVTFASTLDSLRYIKFGVYEHDNTSNGTLNGTMDNVKFYNGVNTVN